MPDLGFSVDRTRAIRTRKSTPFTSLDTQMNSFHSQVELLPVFTTSLVNTNHNGGEQEGIVKKSQMCDRSVTGSSNKDKLISSKKSLELL